jgi:hypothetical protein
MFKNFTDLFIKCLPFHSIFSMAGDNVPAESRTHGKLPPGDPDPRIPGDAAAGKSSANKIVIVKGSVTGIDWRNDFVPVLLAFATTIHSTTFHAYSFSKYTFMPSCIQTQKLT